ncbi:leucine-rich repeats and immunoglobulin-like domains protein 3 [Daktulosphaira vitifoliae]|uniref:leucine-rich repeats and immunoglobulin-like domains protein 3 n=1 Tax=Daktulosphaira vitifoliae TaxID=58002 RepID=UPI0021AAD29F|nr:leucine-rich repeats and immunoglobulin-like domains protein 3 [Daktulosphaira vitifoliae]
MSIVYLLFLLIFLQENTVCNCKNECPKKCECLDTYVDCSGKKLNKFPEPLPLWTESLDLSSNKISGIIKITIDSYFRLLNLKLNKNSIITFPFFMNKTRINILNLAHNKIDKLDYETLKNLPNLTTLDLNQNKLTVLNNNIFPSSNQLRALNLNNNYISSINVNTFDSLVHLLELKLSHNKLKNLPIGLFKKLDNLLFLDLSKNHITVIEGLLFKDLGNLKTVILRQNNIEDLLDGSFYGLSSLKALHLESNSLSKVSKGWLYGLNSLVYLNISHNKIDELKNGWEYCPTLEELDLSNNKLQSIEENSLENLGKLQKLYLDINRISFIEEGSFNNTPSLQMLNMDNNHLAWMVEDVRGPFNGLKYLKKLSLAANNILYIKKDAFYGLENLIELNLLHNNIVEIQESSFKYLPRLVYLYLNTSSLVCDCSLLWLKQPSINEPLSINFINAFCGFPEKNKGKSLGQIPVTDFLCLSESPKPSVVLHPESKMALEGQNITLKCGVNSSSSEKMHFIWKKDNHDLDSLSINHFHYSSFEYNGVTQYSILTLTNISMSQSGKYQCVASNEFGIAYSNRSLLSIVVFPFFIKVPDNSSVKTGCIARLECAANGYPIPQISWQKDGGNDFPAAQERRMKVMAKDDVFFIVDVKLVDMGVYSCTAKNIAGTTAANATLTVLEPPSFGSIMYDKRVKVGEEIVLECFSKGSPKPKIKWMKNGISLNSSNRHFFTADDQLLVIMETNVEDSGNYQCEIANSLGIKIQEAEIIIMPYYRSLIHDYALGLVIIAVIVCIVITSAIWVLFIYRTRRSSSLINNSSDNKSINSMNSKDSGTGESPKRSEEQLYTECLNSCSKSNNGKSDLTPEITIPLLPSGTVVLGDNSVKYCTNNELAMPVQLPIQECNHDDRKCGKIYCFNTSPNRPCSIPIYPANAPQYSSSFVQQPNSYVCLYVPTEKN